MLIAVQTGQVLNKRIKIIIQIVQIQKKSYFSMCELRSEKMDRCKVRARTKHRSLRPCPKKDKNVQVEIQVNYNDFSAEDEGRAAEADVNKIGPGEAVFIFCDVRKEEDIKVVICIL